MHALTDRLLPLAHGLVDEELGLLGNGQPRVGGEVSGLTVVGQLPTDKLGRPLQDLDGEAAAARHHHERVVLSPKSAPAHSRHHVVALDDVHQRLVLIKVHLAAVERHRHQPQAEHLHVDRFHG